MTSPSNGDGRSTTAIDLAATFAEAGRSVILVEGDFVSPVLTERLGLTEAELARATQRGLGTTLAGDHEVSVAVIQSPGGAPFDLLPAGPSAFTRRRLWGDEGAGRTIEALRKTYDYVLIDTPPLTSCSDGAVAAALGDGAIVLARIGHTTTKGLRAALQDDRDRQRRIHRNRRDVPTGAQARTGEAARRGTGGRRCAQEGRSSGRCAQEGRCPASPAPAAAPAAPTPAKDATTPAKDATPGSTAGDATAGDLTAKTSVIATDTSTEAINQAGAHRLSGFKRDGR